MIAILSSCENTVESETPINKPSITSVSTVDGSFKVDTHVINAGQNFGALMIDLEKSTLIEKKTMAGVPDFIKAFLDSISYDKSFDIANPGEDWQVGCTTDLGNQIQTKIYDKEKKDTVMMISWDGIGKRLPSKQLVYFGLGKNIALLSYFTGGIGKSQHVNIIKFNSDKIVDFWFEMGIPFGSTKNELIKYIKRDPLKKENA